LCIYIYIYIVVGVLWSESDSEINIYNSYTQVNKERSIYGILTIGLDWHGSWSMVQWIWCIINIYNSYIYIYIYIYMNK